MSIDAMQEKLPVAPATVLAGTAIGSGFYLWTAPAWFALWLMTNARKPKISPLIDAG
jgi:hypothetical protein